LLDYN